MQALLFIALFAPAFGAIVWIDNHYWR